MTGQTVSAAVETNTSKALEVVWSRKRQFEAVLPDQIDVKSFVGLAAGALYRDANLMKAAEASPLALVNALMRCATLGHQPGTEEFYLIPRKIKGRDEIQGIEGYRGIIERMYRSGAVASVIVQEVCANDTFRFVLGQDERPLHEVDWFGGDRGVMIGVYAYAVLTTGATSRVVVLNGDDIAKIRAKSDSAKSDYSPWNTNERAMWWKSAARRLEPWVPTSAEYRREQLRAVAEASNVTHVAATDAGTVNTDTGEIVDAELVDASAQTHPAGEFGSDEQARP